MKKKKKTLRLVITILLLALLVAGYLMMMKFVKDDEAEESGTEEDNSFTVSKVAADTIDHIVYTQDGEEIELVLEDAEEDSWSTPNDPECPVNNYQVSNMKSTLSEIKSERKIKPEDIDEKAFGLDKPSKTITFETTEGEKYQYELGILNTASQKYYFRKNDDDNAYLIDSTLYNVFDYDLLKLAKVEEYPALGTQDVYAFTVKTDDEVWYFEDAKDAAHKKNEDEIPECVWQYGTDKAKLQKMDSDEAQEMISALIGLSNSECVTYKMNAKDKKKYGLENPTITLQVNYTDMKSAEKKDSEGDEVPDAEILDHSYTLYVGDTNPDTGEYYVNLEGSKAIYTMNVSKIETLLSVIQKDAE